MYYRRFRKPSKPAIFAMLMIASAVMVLLPRDFFAPARNMTQLIALPQYAVSRATQRVSKSANALRSEPVSARVHDDTVKAKQAVENENIALLQKVTELQKLLGQLDKFRRWTDFPQDGRLIPARVVGWDAVSGRDSLSLLKGRSSDVRQGDWVASYLDVQAGTESGVRDDLRVLARQTLVGWIEQSAPYVSRMVLLSDAHSKRKWRVNIVAMNRPNQQDTFVADGTEHADFALEGIGKGQMRVLDVNARYITEGQIRIGDVVTTDGSDPKLPLAMVIGDIVDLKKIKEQPLLYHAIVQHRCPPKDLTEVLVVDIPH